MSIENVAELAAQDSLPEPTLDLSSLQSSTSNIVFPPGRASNVPTYNDDPWGNSGSNNFPGSSSSVAGSGLASNWWKREEKMTITIIGTQGFILNRYTVYEVRSEVRPSSFTPVILSHVCYWVL